MRFVAVDLSSLRFPRFLSRVLPGHIDCMTLCLRDTSTNVSHEWCDTLLLALVGGWTFFLLGVDRCDFVAHLLIASGSCGQKFRRIATS